MVNIPFPPDFELVFGACLRLFHNRIERWAALILEVFDGISSDNGRKSRGHNDA